MRIYTLIECNVDDAFEPNAFYCSNDPDELFEEIEEYINNLPDEEQADIREQQTDPMVEAFKKLIADNNNEVPDGKYVLAEPYIVLVTDI